MYKEIWTPKVGDDSLYLKREDDNEHGKYAVAVMIRETHWWACPKEPE